LIDTRSVAFDLHVQIGRKTEGSTFSYRRAKFRRVFGGGNRRAGLFCCLGHVFCPLMLLPFPVHTIHFTFLTDI